MKIETLKQKTWRVWLFTACLAAGFVASHIQALNIDQVSAKVRQTLATRGSESKYQTLCAAYNAQVHKIETFLRDFLDHNNRTSAESFVNRLKHDLDEFNTLIINPIQHDEFLRTQLHADVHGLHNEFRKMFAMLQDCLNKKCKSGWILAPKLLPYTHLIPENLRQRYNDPMVVINGLNHRLKCS